MMLYLSYACDDANLENWDSLLHCYVFEGGLSSGIHSSGQVEHIDKIAGILDCKLGKCPPPTLLLCLG